MAEGRDIALNIVLETKQFLLSLGTIKEAVQAIAPSAGLIGFASQLISTGEEALLLSESIKQVKEQFDEFFPSFDNLSNRALKLSTAFGEAQGKVATLSNDSEGLANATRTLAKDLNGQVTSTDLLNASYDTLSSGVVGTAANIEVLKASVLGAKGGFSDIGTVSDATTTIINAYGKSTGDAAKIVDQLIATQNQGKIVVGEYAALIGQAATIASQAGVSFEEFSAFVATATASGVQAGASVTGLRQAIASLLKPNEEAVRTAGALGVAFDGQALKSKGLAAILQEVFKASKDGVAFNENLVKLFGSVEAVTAILPSAGDGAANYAKNLSAITNSSGLAAQAASAVAGTFQGEVSQSFVLAQELLIGVGKGVEGVVRPLVRGVNATLAALNALPEPLKQAFGAVSAVGGIALAAVVSLLPGLAIGFVATKALAAAQAFAAGSAGAFSIGLQRASAQLALMELHLAGVNVGTAAFTNVTGLAGLKLIAADVALTAYRTGLAGIPAILGLLKNGLILAGKIALDFAKFVVVSIGQVIVKFALLIAAADAVTNTFSQLGEATFGTEFTQSLNALNKELSETKKNAEDAGVGFDVVFSGLDRSKGIIDGTATVLNNLINGLTGGALASDRFGESGRLITRAQQQAQDQTIRWGDTVKQFNSTLDEGTALLAKYGLTQFDAADKARLGAAGIAAFKDEAAKQISTLNQQIDALKKVKGADKENQDSINTTITLLEKQKGVIQSRISSLDSESKATQSVVKSLKDLNDGYDASTKKIEQSTAARTVAVQEAQAKGDVSAKEAAASIIEIERSSYQERIALANSLLPDLRAKKVGESDPAKLKEINDKIFSIESDGIKARGGLAKLQIDQNKKVEEERKKAESDRIKNLEVAESKARDLVTASAQARAKELIDLEKQVGDQTLEARSSIRIKDLDNQKISLEQSLALESDRIAKLQALQKSLTGDAAEANETKIRQAKLKTGEIVISLTKNEIEQNKAFAEQAAIPYEKQAEALQRNIALLDQSNKLREAGEAITNAQFNAQINAGQREIDSINEGIKLRQELSQLTASDGQKREAILARLSQLGEQANQTEEESIKRRQVLEDAIAAVKIQQLKFSQSSETAALQAVNARALAEAQVNAAIAQGNALRLQGRDAQANQAATDAKNAIAAIQQEGAARLTALGITQADVLANAQKTEEARKYAQKLDLSNAKANDLKKTTEGTTEATKLGTQALDQQAIAAAKVAEEVAKAAAAAKEFQDRVQSAQAALQRGRVGIAGSSGDGIDVLAVKTVDPNILRLEELNLLKELAKTDQDRAEIQSQIDAIQKSQQQEKLSKLEKEIALNKNLLEVQKLQAALAATNSLSISEGLQKQLQIAVQRALIPGFATGVTNFKGGAAIVGENGPELVMLPRGSDVITASDTKKMLSAAAFKMPQMSIPAGFAGQRGASGSNQSSSGVTVQGGINIHTQPDGVQRAVTDALIAVGRRN